MFIFIKQYYAMGLYNADNLSTLKLGGLLTEDQYNELVGINEDTTTTDTETEDKKNEN